MTKPLTLLAIADRDIEKAVSWYDDQSGGLGDSFLLDLDELLEHIRQHPEMYQAVVGKVRRAVFHAFPYSVLYRVLPKRIEVVGVLHSHAHPARLASRSRATGGTQ